MRLSPESERRLASILTRAHACNDWRPDGGGPAEGFRNPARCQGGCDYANQVRDLVQRAINELIEVDPERKALP
jgi:hypothetical protein